MSSSELETRARILEAARVLMEERGGRGVRMSDVAGAAGLSRQAVYLHFASRAELLVATARHLDLVLGLDDRLSRFRAASAGIEHLEAYVEFWGNYIPDVYGMAKALLADRETDEAAAAAWDDRMGAVRASCRATVAALHRDGMLDPEWPVGEAVDLLWTMLSVRNWEHLTIECGWSPSQYTSRMEKLAKHALLRKPEGT